MIVMGASVTLIFINRRYREIATMRFNPT